MDKQKTKAIKLVIEHLDITFQTMTGILTVFVQDELLEKYPLRKEFTREQIVACMDENFALLKEYAEKTQEVTKLLEELCDTSSTIILH